MNLTLSKSDAAELTNDIAVARKILIAGIATAADLKQEDSKVTLCKMYVGGIERGRRLQALSDTEVAVQFQIADAKSMANLKASRLAAAVEGAAKAQGIDVVVKKVVSRVGSQTAVWQEPVPARHEDSSVTVLLTSVSVCLLSFVIIGGLAYWYFVKSVPSETLAEVVDTLESPPAAEEAPTLMTSEPSSEVGKARNLVGEEGGFELEIAQV